MTNDLKLTFIYLQMCSYKLMLSLFSKIEIFSKGWAIVNKMPFYAVAKGRTIGIYKTWPDCEAQTKGFPGAKYKKFDTVVGAEGFISSGGNVKQAEIKSNGLNNLKRRLSTSSEDSSDDDPLSDEWNTLLSKHMDDMEKSLKTFDKNDNRLMKNDSKRTTLIESSQNKRPKTGTADFIIDSDGFVQVYTDGACSANGRSGARAGLGVYWGDDHPLNLSEPVSGRATNNCGEIQASTRAIKQALEKGVKKLSINTDSQFVINSVTKWMPGWKRNGWKLKSGEPVKNEIDFKDLDSVKDKLQIKWNYVKGHKGIYGNEMADKLAKEGAAMYGNRKH